MENKKKIILVGPPGVGKTTIKKVFFEKANPLYLLKNPLDPSRGINSSIYSIFNSKIGLFDLAGQENDTWLFEKADEIFEENSVIICVFEISTSLENIINFILEIDRIRRKIDNEMSELIIFFHKVDQFNDKYLKHKLKALNDFFTTQYSMGSGFKIHLTSIVGEYFLKTFFIITNIIKKICGDNFIPISKSEFLDLRTDILIILRSKGSTRYNIKNLISEFRLKSGEITYHIKRLEELAFLKSFENYNFFELTERALFLKIGIERYQNKIIANQINSCIEILHTLRNMHKLEA
jgi:GTPase SAR1 family protein